jgi:hypothetical protein
MLTVFLLMMFVGTGDERREVRTNLRFYSVTECNFFAKELARRYGNYAHRDWMDRRDRVTTYCVPDIIAPGEIEVY